MNPQPTNQVYLTFAGQIDQQAVSRIFATLNLAVNSGMGTVHLLIQSTGGFVDDGIAVYNYLTHLPLKVVTYNEGTVQSIAVLMYLAGKRRVCAGNASFLMHKTTFAFQGVATAEMMRGRAEAAEICDKKTDAIFRGHLTMPAEKWALRDKLDLMLNADEAKQYGLSHEIGNFAVPLGGQVFNI